MNRVFQIALREFYSTAITKGFIIAAFVVPGVIVAVMVIVFPILLATGATAIHGRVAIWDPTGRVAAVFEDRLSAASSAERSAQATREAMQKFADKAGVEAPTGFDPEAALNKDESVFEVESLDPEADLDAVKESLWKGAKTGNPRVALVVIEPNAIEKGEQGDYGGYEIYHKPRFDPRHLNRISGAVESAVRSARITAADIGIPETELRSLFRVRNTLKREVSEEGERASLGEIRIIVSIGFMILIFIPVMFGGQFLVTTMVEEKSSRVVEVLLSAVSPFQLMTGKILGQLAVGLSILIIYGTIGGGALVAFKMSHLLGPVTLISFVVFFLIAYFTLASFMAAIGSAVNDLREAQSLQSPVMMVLIVPYLLAMPITANPSSAFSTTVSFIPVINPFAMMLRITSHEPPPLWQIGLSALIGIATALVFVWAAAKVFRIGLLLHGKPPSFATLIRWVRMA